jgi:hypothetical protein
MDKPLVSALSSATLSRSQREALSGSLRPVQSDLQAVLLNPETLGRLARPRSPCCAVLLPSLRHRYCTVRRDRHGQSDRRWGG